MLCTLNEKAPICVLFFVLLIGIIACENRNPVADESLIRHQTYKRDEDQWAQDIRKFIADSEALIQGVSLLKNHPGWPDFFQIVKSFYSIQYLEGKDTAARKNNAAIALWSETWQSSGSEILQKYNMLSSKSQELEKRRLTLIQRSDSLKEESFQVAISYRNQPQIAALMASQHQSTLRWIDRGIKVLLVYRLDSSGLCERTVDKNTLLYLTR